jgi:hypothetical protein
VGLQPCNSVIEEALAKAYVAKTNNSSEHAELPSLAKLESEVNESHNPKGVPHWSSDETQIITVTGWRPTKPPARPEATHSSTL